MLGVLMEWRRSRRQWALLSALVLFAAGIFTYSSIPQPMEEQRKAADNQTVSLDVTTNDKEEFQSTPQRKQFSTDIQPISPAEKEKSLSLLNQFHPEIQPLWHCDANTTATPTNNNHSKLIFVHIFKTAGSSLRSFFDKYGQACGKGVALVVDCSNQRPPHNTTEVWQHWKPCELKSAYNRHHDHLAERWHNLTTAMLPQLETDILMGHMSLGLHQGWLERDQQPVTPQYVTFFRDPLSKLVSARTYTYFRVLGKNWTREETVQQIKASVYEDVAKQKYYEVYSQYLLTPWQKQEIRTTRQKIHLVQENLVRFPIIIGMVEEMDASLELLAFALQEDLHTSEFLQRLTAHEGRSNQAEISTSVLVADLQKDEAFLPYLHKYLQFESVLYDFARQLHQRQVEWVRQQVAV
jgi:Sulfotransferase family